MDDKKLYNCFKVLSSEAKDFYLRTEVPVVDYPVTPLEFYREWVAPNVPVIIKGAVRHWDALTKWTNDYLRDAMGHKKVKVAATPNGYADAIADGYFVMPEEREMIVSDFLSAIEDLSVMPGTVLYVQSQNGNLSGDWIDLMEDIESDLPWATEAFGEPPTAANFWMGDQRAVTSMHRDPFENIYCVVRGYKDFILHAPIDLPWIPYATLPMAQYQSIQEDPLKTKFEVVPLKSGFEDNPYSLNDISDVQDRKSTPIGGTDFPEKSIEDDMNDKLCCKDPCVPSLESRTLKTSTDCLDSTSCQSSKASKNNESFDEIESSHVPWICVDPVNPDLMKYPLYANATQVKVRVHAGDVLFLPAHWFHHVRQSHGCIAVNYWYDVRFDHRHAHQAFITALLRNSGMDTGCPPLC